MVDSLSKRFSLCGARIGCLVTWNSEVRQAAFHIAQARLAAPTIEQHAAAKMLDSISGAYLEAARHEYEARRNVAVQAVRSIDGAVVQAPGGGFYLLAKLPIDDADAFASFLLKDFSFQGETVFIAPASGFYMHREAGRSAIRIAFVLAQRDTERAIGVLAEGVRAYKSHTEKERR
jgi:aspartate aminotransferase